MTAVRAETTSRAGAAFTRNPRSAKALLGLAIAGPVMLCGTPARAAPGDIYVTFLARPTAPITEHTPGHAFFCISLHLNQGTKEDCFGFYPEKVLKAFNGPGKISNEFKKDSIPAVTVSLAHKIAEETRLGLYKVIESYAGKDYKLLINNCADLVLDVAKRAGLRTPDRNTVTLPTETVEGLEQLYWKGQWQSGDPQSRFELDIATDQIGWGERNTSGAVLAIKVPFSPKDGSVRIERPNDDKVLAHLGYQPTLRSQIIAAAPKPSFLVLQRIDNRIEAQWNGLIVTKDDEANMKELKQPGSTPSKSYTFDRL